MAKDVFAPKQIKVTLGKGHGRWASVPNRMTITTAKDSGGEYLYLSANGDGSEHRTIYLSVEDAIELSFILFDFYEDKIPKE